MLRSRDSTEKVSVRFVNLTDKTVQIIWVNYVGAYVKYHNMPPHTSMDVTTYKTHPWLALDMENFDHLLMNNSFVYNPVPWREHHAHHFLTRRGITHEIPDGYEPRIMICIKLPLHSLRLIALRKVRDLLRDEEDINALGLPGKLAEDLKKAIRVKQVQKSIAMIAHGN